MNNHWIIKSKERKFGRLKRIIEGQWVGISTKYTNKSNSQWEPGDKMTVFIKIEKLKVTGNVPSGLAMGIGKIGTTYPRIFKGDDPNDLVFIILENVEDWFIKYRIADPITGIIHWIKKHMPRFEDPAFVPMLEAVISKTVEDWKREEEKKRQEKEKQEEEKCKTSSSS